MPNMDCVQDEVRYFFNNDQLQLQHITVIPQQKYVFKKLKSYQLKNI